MKNVKSKGQSNIYKNTLNLPNVKVTNQIYNSDTLKTHIDREHAMLDGVVIKNSGKPYTDHAKNLSDATKISYKNRKGKNNQQK
ncbi:hypothetical protein [Staphylococcus ureilyticus]|uniref:hypothetical protein n=1 Tax=Staphylococcus ureilyticus TaxID=94138 RepID=UPI0039DF9888